MGRKYYLDCPNDPPSRLSPKGNKFLSCLTCGKIYSLRSDQKLERRTLHEHNAKDGKTSPTVAAEVPADWDGEPQTVGIPRVHWLDRNSPLYQNLVPGIRTILAAGDHVVVFDDQEQRRPIIGQVFVDKNGDLELVPTPSRP